MTVSFVSKERGRLQRALVARAEGGPYYKTEYVGDEQRLGPRIQPAEIIANEIGATFGTTRLNRRDWKRERLSWTWELRLGFKGEASVEEFEQEVSDSPILVVRDETHENQVYMDLVSARYDHPPRQSAGAGTRVVFTFEARLSPV